MARKHHVEVVDLCIFGSNLPRECPIHVHDACELSISNLRGFDAVIFLAGLSNDPMADFDPFGNFVANGAVPAYIAHLCTKAGVPKFIHGGSCSVYGKVTRPVDELHQPRTFSPYGVSKLQGEIGCHQQRWAGLNVVAFRMGTVCGWSPRMRFDLIINTMVKDAWTKQEITVNDESAARPILDIRDAVACYIQAVEALELSGTANIFSGNYTVGEIAQTIRQLAEEALGMPIRITNRKIPDVRSYTVESYFRSHTNVKFKPTITLSDTIKSVLDNIHTIPDTSLAQFYNIETYTRWKKVQQPAGWEPAMQEKIEDACNRAAQEAANWTIAA